MKEILIFSLLLFVKSLSAQTFTNPNFYGNTQIGNGNTQNNYSEHHLSDDDKAQIDKLLSEIHKTYKSAGKKYIVYTEMGSNAGAVITDVKKYLATKGYTQDGVGSGISSAGNTEGVKIYYGTMTPPRAGEKSDSTIIIHFGTLN